MVDNSRLLFKIMLLCRAYAVLGMLGTWALELLSFYRISSGRTLTHGWLASSHLRPACLPRNHPGRSLPLLPAALKALLAALIFPYADTCCQLNSQQRCLAQNSQSWAPFSQHPFHPFPFPRSRPFTTKLWLKVKRMSLTTTVSSL